MILSFAQQLRNLHKYINLKTEEKVIAFYAEDPNAWMHFNLLIRELINTYDYKICYITSCHDDPVLANGLPNLAALYIGKNAVLTNLFRLFDSKIVIMTMPDLGSYHLKRTNDRVHYIYLFHSMVSTHMIYRKGAFDNYDSIFCVGPHHLVETKETEAIYNLKPKVLVKYGYGWLDTLLQHKVQEGVKEASKTVMIAPSWGKGGILEALGNDLINTLLEAGHSVIFRPHPQSLTYSSKIIANLVNRYKNTEQFTLEKDIRETSSLARSCILISDWSGIALEYSFWLNRPIIYFDVMRKINNSEYNRLSSIPIELYLRDKIGVVLSPNQVNAVPSVINYLISKEMYYAKEIPKISNEYVYNLGGSAKSGANYIHDLLNDRI